MAELFRYAAFISYSSKDARFAQRLHRALESYGIPASLGKFDLIGGGKVNRIYPVFRDREELSAGRLGEQIEANLKAASALIVICSPNSAASPWVQKEIEFFVGLGRSDRIFAIIPDDAPLTDESGADCTPICFPPAFRGDALQGHPLEPLAADARNGKDGFRSAWLKIVAGMIGVTPGQIIDRDRRRMRQRRFQIALGAGVAAFAASFVGAQIVTQNWRTAMSSYAEGLVGQGSAVDAMTYAVASSPTEGSLVWAQSPGAQATLSRLGRTRLLRDVGTPVPDLRQLNISATGRVLIAESWRSGILLNIATGEVIQGVFQPILSGDGQTLVATNNSGHILATLVETRLAPAQIGDFSFQWSGRPTQNFRHLSFDGSMLFVGEEDEDGYAIDLSSGGAVTELGELTGVQSAVLSDDGDLLLTNGRAQQGSGLELWAYDLARGGARHLIGPADASSGLAMSSDRGMLMLAGRHRLSGQQVVVYRGDVEVARVDVSNPMGVQMSSDGRALFVLRSDFSATFHDITTGETTEAEVSRAELGDYEVLDLASDDRDDRLYDLTRAAESSTLGEVGAVTGLRAFDLSADRNVLAIADQASRIVLYDLSQPVWPVDAPPTNTALVSAICAASGDAMRPFTVAARGGVVEGSSTTGRTRRDIAGALRGRPWNPCDWRGLSALFPNSERGDAWFEGPRQWWRLRLIRWGLKPDYRCQESTFGASQQRRERRAESCRMNGTG